MTAMHDPCDVCALIREGSAAGRVELWRGAETITYVSSPGPGSVSQIAVAPLRHAPTILDVTDEEFVAVIGEAREAAAALVRVLDPEGFTLHQHNGAVEQQAAAHLELMLGAKAFGTEFGEVRPEWRQEPWVLNDTIVAQWNETYDQRVQIVEGLRRALATDSPPVNDRAVP